MKGQRWVLVNQFDGEPKESDIQLQEFELPEIKDGQVLLQAVYLTVDPYMRAHKQPTGNPVIGQSLAEVLESKNGKYPVGSLVMASSGWQSHFVSTCGEAKMSIDGSDAKDVEISPIMFDLGKTKPSYTLGCLGMPGATAYCGLNKCDPKKGETLFVSSAAGAVGHVVGQLAKIKGLTVIGSASTPEKIAWLKELGFDHVINYKTQNVFEELKRVAPEGIDIYFDNVGGDHYHNIINDHMRKYGRVLVCGSIQTYNVASGQEQLYAATNFSILGKELTIYGFMVPTYGKQWPAAFAEMNGYIQSGQMKTRETEFVGFEKMRDAFFEIFKSTGIGKQVIKCVNEKTNYP